MTLTTYLAADPTRCQHGYAPNQGHSCRTGKVTAAEWATFTDALSRAADADGVVHQRDVRPLLRGRVEPKHIGSCYTRAKREGLLTEIRREPSDDARGRNTNKWEPVYALHT